MTEIHSRRLLYKSLMRDDVTVSYVGWLNDPEVNRYIEARHCCHTLQSCRSFVAQIEQDRNQHLLGIFVKPDQIHIGNVKISLVDQNHHIGQIGILIGKKEFWGKGFATEAIQTITNWGFNNLDLQKIEAGCYEENLGSLRAFLKSGYQVEGFLRSHSVLGEKRVGNFLLGILPDERISLPSK